jgi:hypothetical protein
LIREGIRVRGRRRISHGEEEKKKKQEKHGSKLGFGQRLLISC